MDLSIQNKNLVFESNHIFFVLKKKFGMFPMLLMSVNVE